MLPCSPGKVGRGSSQDRMESVCRVVIGHAWPNVSNVITDQNEFYSLKGGAFLRLGCLSTLRSLWPVGDQSLWLKTSILCDPSLWWLWSPLKCWCLGMNCYIVAVWVCYPCSCPKGLHKTVDGERIDVLYNVPRSTYIRWLMFYLNNQHFDIIIRVVVNIVDGLYCGRELSSPPQEWLMERSVDMA